MNKLISAIVASLAVTAACAVEYTLIPYSSAMTATGSSEYNAERGFVYAIDGSGLSTVNGVLVHTDSYQNKMWMSGNVTLSASAPKFYCVDLGETYLLGQIKIWNFNQSGQQSRGFKATEIYVTDNAEAAKSSPSDVRAWGSAVWTGELSKATGNNDKGCAPIEISPTRARYVAFVCTTSHGDDGFQGLSEVRFFSAPEGMPSFASTSVALNANQDGFDASATLGAGANDSELATLVYTSEEDDPLRLSLGTAAAGETKSLSLATLAASTTYAVRFEAANAVTSVTNKDVVSIYTGEPTLSWKSDGLEKGTVPAEVTVSRAAVSPYPIDVHYSLASTDGVAGVDYVPATGVVTIPAGAASAVIAVMPIVNPDKSEDVHVTVTLEAGASYLKMQPASVDVVIVNASIPANANVWVAGGSSDGLASTASNWSKGVPRADAPESLVILVDGNYSTQSMVWDSDGTTDLASTVTSWTQTSNYTGTVTFNTTFPSYAASTFQTFTVTGDMTVEGGTLTHPQSATTARGKVVSLASLRNAYTYRLNISAGSFTLGSGAKIDLKGKGHYAEGLTLYPSHGGRYEDTTIGCYGNVKYPEDLGLGSDLGTDKADKWSKGGGAVKLSVTGVCTIDGEISVDGAVSSGNLAAGSAGSILIEANSVTGNGTGLVHADGVYCNNGSYRNGAPGRVAVLTTLPVDMTKVTFSASGTASGKYAPSGTVFVKDNSMTHGVLYLRNRFKTDVAAQGDRGTFVTNEEGVDWTFDRIVLGGSVQLYVPTGTTLTLPNGFASVDASANAGKARASGIVCKGGTINIGSGDQMLSGNWYFAPASLYTFPGNVTLANGAAIGYSTDFDQVKMSTESDYLNMFKVRCKVTGDLTVPAGCSVTATGAGGGYVTSASFTSVKIGAHGGSFIRRDKGKTDYTTPLETHDSVFHPMYPAMQDQAYTYVNPATAIDLEVGGTLNLEGTIEADGITSGGCLFYAVPGSVYVKAGALVGTSSAARISASGCASAQAGGRVAVVLSDPSSDFSMFAGSIVALNSVAYNGDVSAASYVASPGSVYTAKGSDADKCGEVLVRSTVDCHGLATPICATGYKADAVEDFKRASLRVAGTAVAKVSIADQKNVFKMRALTMTDTSALDLNGKTFIVKRATLGGTKLRPGTYKASDYPAYLVDSLGTDGTLQVEGLGLKFIIR